MDETLALTLEEQEELRARTRSRSLRAEYVRRERLILLLDTGRSYTEVQQILSRSATYVSRWKTRFMASVITAKAANGYHFKTGHLCIANIRPVAIMGNSR